MELHLVKKVTYVMAITALFLVLGLQNSYAQLPTCVGTFDFSADTSCSCPEGTTISCDGQSGMCACKTQPSSSGPQCSGTLPPHLAEACSCSSGYKKCENQNNGYYYCSCMGTASSPEYVNETGEAEYEPSIVYGYTAPKNLDRLNFNVESPLKFNSIESFVVAILQVFIVIATPIIVLYIIYAGFLYVTARGNVEQTKQATTSLTYAIIGGVLILGAVALSEVLKGVIEAFTK